MPPRSTLGAAAILLVACGSPADATVRDSLSHLEVGGPGPVVLVMVHGYGSRPEDLLGFAQRTDFPHGTRVLMPRAPALTHPPVGPEGGRMWWLFPHDFHDLRHQQLDGVRQAQRALSAFLDRETDADDRVVLGGFSQGALLVLELAAHDPRPLEGLVLLSGTLMNQEELVPRLPSRAGLRVHLAHGLSDDVLPYARAEDLRGALVGAGLDVRFAPFEGGHEVTLEVSERAAAFVRDLDLVR